MKNRSKKSTRKRRTAVLDVPNTYVRQTALGILGIPGINNMYMYMHTHTCTLSASLCTQDPDKVRKCQTGYEFCRDKNQAKKRTRNRQRNRKQKQSWQKHAQDDQDNNKPTLLLQLDFWIKFPPFVVTYERSLGVPRDLTSDVCIHLSISALQSDNWRCREIDCKASWNVR